MASTPKDRSLSATPARSGFSLIELLVVLGVITILIALFTSVIGGAMERARSVRCEAQLRGFGPAVQMFRDANRGQLPYADNFVSFGSGYTQPWDQLKDYLDVTWPVVDRRAGEIRSFPPLVCPSDREFSRGVGVSYAYPLWVWMSSAGQAFVTMNVDIEPSRYELFRDGLEFHSAGSGERGMNALWADYSIRRVPR